MRPLICLTTLFAAAILASCSGPFGPPYYYPIGGTYTGNITYQMTGDTPLAAPVVPGITVNLNDPDGQGNFNGNFAFNTGYTNTGNIYGQFSSDGSTINFVQFGDTLQPVFYVGSFLATAYSPCNFKGSTFTLSTNGGFDGNGNFDMTGSFTGIRCATSPSDSVQTTMNVSLAVYNPSPEAVKKSLGLSPALLGGSQQVH